jgi:membrane protein implicated in regulation of membrane protease activity
MGVENNMQTILSNPVYAWLAFGALLIVFEAFTAPGLGIFLGGLGAIGTGLLVEGGVIGIDNIPLQAAAFFGLTAFWAVALWKPLMKFRAGKNKNTSSYSDVVGGTATVAEDGLTRGKTGQVKWSGTLMNAELDESSAVSELPAGALVTIKSVSGNVFKVVPK